MSAATPGATVHVLHLEDSSIDADLICEYLRQAGADCAVERVWTRDDFVAALHRGGWDLILADHQLPTFDGEAALEIARATAPEIPFIFVSGTLGEDVAVEALKRGATDYVVKQRLHRLPDVVSRALAEAAARAERRRAEAALKVSEANFATLVDAMPQLCFMSDTHGRVTWCNRRWCDYTGLSPDHTRGQGWRAAVDPAALDEIDTRWALSLADGSPFEMTVPLLDRDGQPRPFLCLAVAVRDDRDAVVRWLGTYTDVSAQRAAEAELKRLNETLEARVVAAVSEREAMFAQLSEMQKMETIGQLTGGVAHDFNNLLTPIVGNLDMLRRRLDGDDRALRLIAGAMQGAERAKTLVQRLLAFARRQVLEPRAVDVHDLVSGMTELIGRTIGPQIAIAVEADGDLPPARVDPGQLELALLNLAVNARDAMPGGGALRFAIDRQQVGPDHPHSLRHGDYVRLAVTDTGTGMDPATLKRAIEPFYSTKGVGKGTGLGLSMVHGLAAQSGGALLLHSAPGQGTRAEIWLPIAEGHAEQLGAAGPGEVPRTRRATILLVDDEDLVRAGTAEMLADLGHHVIEAHSAAQALELVRGGEAPDLVITDYLMPGMNGADLAAELRRLHPTLPIMLATGYANLAGNQMASLPLLPKPFRQAELAARLVQLLEPRPRAAATRVRLRSIE
ncbi:response regulator [Sphingomonas morindae]|uniref:histidine kinase n=1 Tax=Sphingomonas morindae TaxID=1541170 RepID=A0ABY4X3G9_9SPHN|nr:response regulator [Sphingomonas morindae]USI71436.1 response regulator [Sphingomonas morindae]